MDEDQLGRIVECINSCWPDFAFSANDLNSKKPMPGDKFRELLFRFLKGFLGGNYQLPNVAVSVRNPEMYGHMESTISLYRDINSVLKALNYESLFYGDLFRPTPAKVRDVLTVLVNFLAYFESEEGNKEDVEEEVIKLKGKLQSYKQRLEEEERHLYKSQQNAEQIKLNSAELRKKLLKSQEKYLTVEASITKLETEVEEITKGMMNVNVKLDQATLQLKQIELEKEKAAESVVPDPEALESELLKSQLDKESLLEDVRALKDRLPLLESQLQERSGRLQEHKDCIQRLALVKIQEAKIKSEWDKSEMEMRLADEERQALQNQMNKETNLIDSKKRTLEELTQKMEILKTKLEKIRSDLKQCKIDEGHKREQLETRLLTLDNELLRLKQDILLGQKALDEGVVVLAEIHQKHERNLEVLRQNLQQQFNEVENLVVKAFGA